MAWLKYLKVREVSLVDKAANPEARILFHKRDDVSAAQYLELAKGWLEESFDSIFTDPDLSPRQTMDALLQTGKEFVDEVVKFVPETQARDEFRTLLSKSYNKKKPKKGKPINTPASDNKELMAKPGDERRTGGPSDDKDEHHKFPTNPSRKDMSKSQFKTLGDGIAWYVKSHMIPEDKGDVFTASERLLREDPFAKRLLHASRQESRSGELDDLAGQVRKDWPSQDSQVGDVFKNKMDEIQKKYPRMTRGDAFDMAPRESSEVIKQIRSKQRGGA
jgi:hypothetical protein